MAGGTAGGGRARSGCPRTKLFVCGERESLRCYGQVVVKEVEEMKIKRRYNQEG